MSTSAAPIDWNPATAADPDTDISPSRRAGLRIVVIDGDHITLMAPTELHDTAAISHRLRSLIIDGARHISIDFRSVGDVSPEVAACLTGIALCLTDVGGTLNLLDVQPAVSGVFERNGDAHRYAGAGQA